MVASLHPFEIKCLTSRVDILPAPIMHILLPSKLLSGNLSLANSTAAELTETEPLAMEVSVRTRLPATIA